MANYPTYCPIARSLDTLGDRWTLLILRELARGERRFTDLRDGLPGIAPNLLSQRLKELTAEGLVTTRVLAPPAARTVYVATAEGLSAVPVLRSLARFGFRRLEPADEHTPIAPDAAVSTAVKAFYDPLAAGDLDEKYELMIDGETFVLASAPGGGHRPDNDRPDLYVRMPAWVLMNARRGKPTLDEGLMNGLVDVEGAPSSLANFRRVFQFD